MPFDLANLRLRVISVLVLAPVILLIVYIGGWLYTLAVIIFLLLAFTEWLGLLPPIKQLHVKILAYICLFAIICSALRPSLPIILVFVIFLALDLYVWSMQEDFKLKTARDLALGVFALAACGFGLIYLRNMSVIGRPFTYYLLFVVWGMDIGGYMAGKIIGGPKLVPVISPNKTWAGLIGGMVLAGAFGYAVAVFSGAWRPGIAFILALFLAVIAQAGDLFKSVYKRRAGVKESGNLIPGHGGVLDRIDGLIFTSGALALFENLAGLRLGWW